MTCLVFFLFLLIFNYLVDFLGVPSVVGSGCATARLCQTLCQILVVDEVHQGLRLALKFKLPGLPGRRVKAKQTKVPSD